MWLKKDQNYPKKGLFVCISISGIKECHIYVWTNNINYQKYLLQLHENKYRFTPEKVDTRPVPAKNRKFFISAL